MADQIVDARQPAAAGPTERVNTPILPVCGAVRVHLSNCRGYNRMVVFNPEAIMAKSAIQTKRAYDAPSDADGTRVLVDRVWPRGVKKADAALDEWLKSVAPTTELRKWFGHDPDKWSEFRRRYLQELKDGEQAEELTRLKQLRDDSRTLTLVFAAKDEAHNNAVVLQQVLQNK